MKVIKFHIKWKFPRYTCTVFTGLICIQILHCKILLPCLCWINTFQGYMYNMMYHYFQLYTTGTYPGTGVAINGQHCIVPALPFPPSNVTNVSVSSTLLQRSEDGLINFVVQWSKPEILNGNATIGPTYQLWIGTVSLPLNANDLIPFQNQRLHFEDELQVSAW